MTDIQDGRVASDHALVYDGAQRRHLAGFDPSRIAASLRPSQVRALLAMPLHSYKSGFQPSTLISLKNASAGTNYSEPRPALCAERCDVAYCRRYVLTEAGAKVVQILRAESIAQPTDQGNPS